MILVTSLDMSPPALSGLNITMGRFFPKMFGLGLIGFLLHYEMKIVN